MLDLQITFPAEAQCWLGKVVTAILCLHLEWWACQVAR